MDETMPLDVSFIAVAAAAIAVFVSVATVVVVATLTDIKEKVFFVALLNHFSSILGSRYW
jgi:type IV secretory pathway component VirB8